MPRSGAGGKIIVPWTPKWAEKHYQQDSSEKPDRPATLRPCGADLLDRLSPAEREPRRGQGGPIEALETLSMVKR